MNANNPALAALRYHVSGAIARGEKQAIVEQKETNIQSKVTKPCENKRAPALHGGGMVCEEAFNCCDCGGNDCGCRYCFSCNACDACRGD